ncbi:MAG TPA: transglycosylase SLT domain-containing protein [Xanthobacteraceae bacterium]
MLTWDRPTFFLSLVAAGVLALTYPAAAEPAEKSVAAKPLPRLAPGKGAKVAPAKGPAKKAAGKARPANKSAARMGSASRTVAVPVPRSRPPAVALASLPLAPKAPLAPPPTRISDDDLSAVRRAIEVLRGGDPTEATRIEAAISDPAARKLVEWIILRNDNNGINFARYAAFIAANPSWPSVTMLRRRAEAMLWFERPDPASARAYFAGAPPLSGKGRLALARALLAQGDRAGAQAQVREAWRNDALPGETEAQELAAFREFITRADEKARMERRLYAYDHEAALRVARRLGGADLAIARARVAANNKSSNAKALLDAVPPASRHDAGYMFARLQVLRRADKIAEAGHLMLSAPRSLAQIHDPDEWWVERRLLARKLLDTGDPKTAYAVARDAASPSKENYRVEQHFTAGWIALRFLDDPVAAAAHFGRIAQASANPISQARAGYWLGRAAQAAHRPQEARAHYEAAARWSTAYYGQLARARLGLGDLVLHPASAARARANPARLELGRALEILYALNERNLIIPFMADLGDKLDDPEALAALGEIAERHEDARAMLQLGKAALARGLPFARYAFPNVGVPSYSAIGPEVDAALVYAIVRQESAFNPGDISSANALGLMQVTPAAGRYLCKKYDCRYDQKRLLRDSVYNVQLGAAEIGGNLQDYRGSFILAFAAYNAGRGRVKEWVARYGDPRDPRVDPVDWVERIPFSETRNYVQRVMENMQVYRVRFGGEPRLTIEADLRRGTLTN